jgi:hypothetical protein
LRPLARSIHLALKRLTAYRAASGGEGPRPFVEDVDAAYARALAAGATAIRPPDNIPYRLRSAIVRDPSGYLWWPARWIEEQ